MAKKKVKYPYRTRNNIITAAVAVVLIAVLITLVALNVSARNYVLTLDGKKASVNDYKYYLYNEVTLYKSYGFIDYLGWSGDISQYTGETSGTTVAQSAVNGALSALIHERITVRECKARGLTLSADQEKTAQDNLNTLLDNLSKAAKSNIGLSNSQLLTLIKGDLLWDNLYADITQDYAFDQADFDTYYQNYLDTNKYTLTKCNVYYILTDTRDEAEDALAKAMGGESMFDLAKEYSNDYSAPQPTTNSDGTTTTPDDPRAATMLASDITQLTDAMKDEIYQLQAGDYSKIYEIDVTPAADTTSTDTSTDASATATPDATATDSTAAAPVYNYIFVYVDSITPPDYDQVKSDEQDTYIKGKKDDIANNAYSQMVNDATISYNQDMISSIDVTTLPQ